MQIEKWKEEGHLIGKMLEVSLTCLLYFSDRGPTTVVQRKQMLRLKLGNSRTVVFER